VHPLFRLQKLGHATLALAAHIYVHASSNTSYSDKDNLPQTTRRHNTPTLDSSGAIHRTHPLNQGLDRRPVRLRFIVLIEAEEDFVARRGGKG